MNPHRGHRWPQSKSLSNEQEAAIKRKQQPFSAINRTIKLNHAEFKECVREKKAFIATTQYFLGPELKVVVKFEAEIRTPKVSTEADFEAIFSLSVFKRPKITLPSN